MRRPLPSVLLLTAACALPAQAGEIVSPAEFRAYAEGHTLYFERNGEPFGAEAFGPDGRARWRFNDGSCVRGVWQQQGAQLCFLYDTGDTQPLCWRMLRDEEGMLARLLDGPEAGLELRVTGRDKAPLLCGDPGRRVRAGAAGPRWPAAPVRAPDAPQRS